MRNESFKDYNLDDEILRSLELLGYQSPTEVQLQVIPNILNKKDIIVKSQTGSGKTAAFGIPLCQLMDWDENTVQALILTPTRELAMQVKEDLFNIGRFKRLKVVSIYGKAPFSYQEKELKQKTHIVVGTPGRTLDHIEKGTLDLSNIQYLIIDEADEMLNMGFIEQIENIISELPRDRVTALFSATIPDDIEELCNKFMKTPELVEIESNNKVIDRILQEVYKVEEDEKMMLLEDVSIVENPDSCIIFCNTQERVNDVFSELIDLDYKCERLHGGMEQRDRIRVISDFKQGYFRYLIATDVAARGLDIDDISLVIQYDIPKDKEVYVHRIGRTGRVDKSGKAIAFISNNQERYLKDIEEYINIEVQIKERPSRELVIESMNDFTEKMNSESEIRESKGTELNKGIMKIHINAGKKTKMRASDIVGTLCSIEGMTKEDIGIINIMDISTFVEILNNKGQYIYDVLQDKPIKGRLRKVSKADGKNFW